ncbi:hypothetical protein [Mycolicibacterium hodleri]|uniref:hypothetical protein n=1 Tax=Mycolicibacterium hodleri TaxID=49897 RepID=UPI0013757999|nr:hypothetical protein [Mycolicibacterium hodleri]
MTTLSCANVVVGPALAIPVVPSDAVDEQKLVPEEVGEYEGHPHLPGGHPASDVFPFF